MFNEAQAMSLKGYADGPQLVQSPFISSAIQEIDFLTNVASETNSTLYELRQRLFGPWPQSGQSGSETKASAPCLESQLQDAICRLRAVLVDSRENAQSLSSRI